MPIRTNSTTLLGEPFSFVASESTGTVKVNALRFEQAYMQRWEAQTVGLRSTFTFGRTNVDPKRSPPRSCLHRSISPGSGRPN